MSSLAPITDRRFDEPGGRESAVDRNYFKTAAEFCAEFEPPSYAVDGLMRSASQYAITARTGHGKTSLLVAVALAVGTGRPDILGRDVEQGRVVFFCGENPDDFRMRLMAAAENLQIDLDSLGDGIMVCPRRDKAEQMVAEAAAIARQFPIGLVVVDTFAAFFDGQDVNSPTQAGEFMRRLRPLGAIDGKPAVMVACHPTKNAGEDALIPYGAGAILNEVDGNLTLWKEGNVVRLHWLGKIRGADFPPVLMRIEEMRCASVVDKHGNQIGLPVMRPADEAAVENNARHAADVKVRLLAAMIDEPNASQQRWAAIVSTAKSTVHSHLKSLERDKLVEQLAGCWKTTAKGRKLAKETLRSQ